MRHVTRLRVLVGVGLACGWLGAAAAAPAVLTGDPFRGVHKGDRVRIVLRNKTDFTGVARSVSKDTLIVDMALEEKGMDATVAVSAERVLKIEVLKPLDAKDVERRVELRRRRQQEAADAAAREAAKRKADDEAQATAAKKADEDAAKKAAEEVPADAKGPGGIGPDDFKLGMELLKEFPPKDGWGTAEDKTVEWFRTKTAALGAALTPAEQRFVDNYALWSKMKDLAEKPPEVGPPAGGGTAKPPEGSAAPAPQGASPASPTPSDSTPSPAPTPPAAKP